jgi:LacI family transcriptional regulator
MSERQRARTRAHTLLDVAEAAGVSTATASRVLSNSTYGVKPELRERVLAAAARLRYVPNAHARALARASTSSVGVIVHDVSDPYFAEITQGILKVAGETGRLAMICHTDRLPEKELEYLALLRAQHAEAVIFAGSGFDDAEFADRVRDEIEAYAASAVRLAVIGRHPLIAHAVIPDNRGGAERVAEALVAHGHRTIGVVNGPQRLTSTNDRLAGFRGGLEKSGVALPEPHIVPGDFTRESGAAGARQLLERVPDLTAIFALNDLMAIGALSVLQAEGVRVPEDVSLVGFDDIASSRDTTPALATVHIPLRELGERALRLAMDDAADAARVEHVPTAFVARESLGTVRRSRRSRRTT